MIIRKRHKAKQNLFRKICKLCSVIFKWLIKRFLRSLLVLGKRVRFSKSGFVLPTVAMVTLVVILLTTVIALRSFDRSKNATNVRVNQAVINAATPALDRARAKIEALLNDQSLPRGTPSDLSLYQAISKTRYTLGDETRLKLAYEFNGLSSIQANTTKVEDDETLTSAWKFPVDTDNNGKFDSYTLYSIYFRSPTRSTDGKFNRARNPLEARTPPMAADNLNGQCADLLGNSNKLLGNSSWFKSGTKLKKSFFVYTATVPITSNNPPTGYENYQGSKGFSALELQQDQSRIASTNNAVVFQDDLEITPGAAFNLNGRIFTNANLLVGGHGSAVRLYQVSSKNSCFYEEDNSKITVGGNVGTGNLGDTTDQTAVTVDLYNGLGNNPASATINGDNRSTTSAGGSQVGYNDAAYSRRIALMKQTAISYHSGYNTSTKKISPVPTVASVKGVTQYPQEVKNGFEAKINAPGGSSLDTQSVLEDQIEIYLKNRTRRVPYAEVASADGTGALGSYDTDGDYIDTSVFTSSPIEPPQAWREPTDSNTRLTLTTANLKQTQPKKQKEDGKEAYLGDRIYVGNNLPTFWKKDGQYVTGSDAWQFLGDSIKWTNPNTEPRYRTTQVVDLPNVGMSDRDGDWENDAAKQPSADEPSVGGLRVITGAGVYRNDSSTITTISAASLMPKPTGLDSGGTIPNAPLLAGESTATPYNLVWSDLMPMKGSGDEPPDLRMRATAVYHYADNAGISQTPIACVSSYYDPTDSTTAKNGKYGTGNRFPWGSGGTNLPDNNATGGRSNNGIVYPRPYASRLPISATYLTELKAQAKLMFPNGRIVNEPLQKALQKLNASGGLADTTKPLSLSENSAVDTGICALKILDGTIGSPSNTFVPHGAIKEASFLNGREVKAIEGSDADPINSDLALEQRQPLEVRVTDIDLNQLRQKTIGGTPQQEYLLPNSGIIYASRNDVLLDLSFDAPNSYTAANKETSKLLSPTDFRLDSTRRPNGIRLINGSNLARDNNFRDEEKGLILVTNLPGYIKGQFNLHQQAGTTTATEEFTDQLDSDWSDFYTRTNALDNNFACRKGQHGCGSNGDQWRPATIISDAISLQSDAYRDGFRNEGDFDLRNNAGSSVTDARKKNGFWDNNFVTSALWWDTGNTANKAYPDQKPSTSSYVGSYLTNGVSPIQRRVDFPEYIMEICRKIPVSSCKPKDWVVGLDQDGIAGLSSVELNLPARQAIGLPAGALVSGTTARPAGNMIASVVPSALIPAARPEDQRYPRRIAFKRNRSGTLVVQEWNGQPTPIPLGVNSLTGLVEEFPYDTYGTGVGKKAPKKVNNALWFRTTANTSGKPYNDPTYQSDKPLAYTSDTRLILPPTPEIKDASGNLIVPSLNLPTGNPASGYTICTDQNSQGSTGKSFIDEPSDIDLGGCPSQTMTQIEATRLGFISLTPDASATDSIVRPIRTNQLGTVVTGTFPSATGGSTTIFTSNPADPSQPVVNVIDISGDFATSPICTTIKLVGNENSIFVFRKTVGGVLKFGGSTSDCGVQVNLDGVDPNNIFWAIDDNLQWIAVNASLPHKMAGNFLIKPTGSPRWETVDFEEGGRILGPNVVPSSSNFTNTKIKAISSAEQPSLVPVLQVHNTDDTPGSTLNIGGSLDRWKQVASTNTIFNAAFVSGNTPSRPGEDTAGLHNFVRFMERWTASVNIKGSFIQYKRSAYATAPFAQKRNASGSGNMSIFGHNLNNTPGGNLPYYNAPTRQWGFDVALLSQPPDLFAQRFTLRSTNRPDEFFREIGRDDDWIKTLLCAAQASDGKGGAGATFTTSAISTRPSDCPVNLPYPANP